MDLPKGGVSWIRKILWRQVTSFANTLLGESVTSTLKEAGVSPPFNINTASILHYPYFTH